MFRILSISFLLLFMVPSFSQATPLDGDVKDLYNQVIKDIYNDIAKEKDSWPELKRFGRHVLKKNKQGIYSIHYRSDVWDSIRKGQRYEFGITIVDINKFSEFSKNEGSFSLGFPLLEIKFSGYMMRGSKTKQFDIQEPIRIHGQRLWNYQQKFVPYKLSIVPVKDTYEINENVDFYVILKNETAKNLYFKDLNAQSLFFLYDNAAWGAREAGSKQSGKTKEVIVKSGESIRKKFRGYGFSSPKEFEIFCSYNMTYKGVNPTASAKITVGSGG